MLGENNVLTNQLKVKLLFMEETRYWPNIERNITWAWNESANITFDSNVFSEKGPKAHGGSEKKKTRQQIANQIRPRTLLFFSTLELHGTLMEAPPHVRGMSFSFTCANIKIEKC